MNSCSSWSPPWYVPVEKVAPHAEHERSAEPGTYPIRHVGRSMKSARAYGMRSTQLLTG